MGFLIGTLNLLMIFTFFVLWLLCTIIPLSHYFGEYVYTNLIIRWIGEGSFSPYWYIASVCFFFISLLSIIFRIKRVRSFRMNDIIVKTKGENTTKISNKAVTNFIFKIVHSIEGVDSAIVRVFTQINSTKIKVKIKLTILEGISYPELNSAIQNLVREKVSKDLGIPHITSISISLDEIIPEEEIEEESEEEIVEEEDGYSNVLVAE